MARIPATEITGVTGRLVKVVARRMLGVVPEPLAVMWHHPKIVMASSRFGLKVNKLNGVDPNLKSFAHMAAVSLVGCSWCLDYAYFATHNEGLDEAKAREVPRWRDSDVFTPLERQVMEYAEAMTVTPPTVTDEMSAALLKELGAPGMIELTTLIAFGNLSARANVALGIEAQGFAAACEMRPLAERATA
jgi:alkylhydroperoxidase family enzyme